MHKYLFNTLELKLTFTPDGPLLIKSGKSDGADPTLPDMNFVRSTHPVAGTPTIYLPGSSLKGVFRSHAERILRTLSIECCDPLGDKACDTKPIFKTQQKGSVTYQTLCPACKLFGHTVMASHFLISDAYPETAQDILPIRQMVAIDRRSGSSVNTFTMETATEGNFQATLLLKNFERWQIGLLALVLRDLSLGRLSVGFGKSRGLGRMNVNYDQLTITYPGSADNAAFTQHVHGTTEILKINNRTSLIKEYGFADIKLPAESDFAIPPQTSSDSEWHIPGVVLTEPQTIEAVLKSLTESWASFTTIAKKVPA
jgi:CRISPR-associated RAMP protein (TIGR02581 family)